MKMTSDYYKIIEQKKIEGSLIEIHCQISEQKIREYEIKVLEYLGEAISLAGFRKGKAPEKLIREKIGNQKILEDSAELAIKELYPKIILENSINIIDHPKITITKIAKDNPLEIKIKVAVLSDFTLPDYKAVSKKIMSVNEAVEVTKEDVDKVINELKKAKAKQSGKNESEIKLDDAFAKEMGEFDNINDFRKQLTENIKFEKEMKAREKKRIALIDELVSKTKIDIPEILIDRELERMKLKFEHDIKDMGGKFEDYLKHAKKTELDLKRDWRADASKRVTIQIILNKISTNEKIFAEKEEIEKQFKLILERDKNANPERVKQYLDMVITNERVFAFLENQKTILINLFKGA